MPIDENGFLEYLQLQGSEPDLVTKSELISSVRDMGYRIGERQLSFYVTEGVLPKSVRVGSRAGAYPRVVVELLAWVLRCRDRGLPVDVIVELLPVWKLLTRARREKRLDVAELEYVARQRVVSIEGSLAIPTIVSEVLTVCPHCRGTVDPDIVATMKDGSELQLNDKTATIGFAIAKRAESSGDESDGLEALPSWYAQTRISVAAAADDLTTDPTTVILGIDPNGALPAPGLRRVSKSENEHCAQTSVNEHR